MSFLEVKNISKQLDGNLIVSDVSFIQQTQQKLAIAGETGSGKSTVLKTIAGLSQADSGNVYFEGNRILGPWEKLIPGHPGIAYLSQQFELPRFLRVEQVLSYANKSTDKEAAELFEICRIGHLLKRKTDQLSGGEQQRIALARLLVGLPKLLLLDEPFSNLDVIHKSLLKNIIKDVEDRLQVTCTIISHDPLDMLSWADEIIVMQKGKIIQQASPQQIYYQPATSYVAGLFGKYNLIGFTLATKLFPQLRLAEDQQLFLRPEQIAINLQNDISVPGKIMEVRFMGSAYEADVQLSDTLLTIRTVQPAQIGETVNISSAAYGAWVM